MEHPVKVAFCEILFAKNGGRFSENGLPIFEEGIVGRCDIAWDCASCSLLNEWVQLMQTRGWEIGWECAQCLKMTQRADAIQGIERFLPGFYSAGRVAGLSPDDPDFDPDLPSLMGCTHVLPPNEDHDESYVCGWQTSFLQLVLRRLRP